jgi:hypothetical protein
MDILKYICKKRIVVKVTNVENCKVFNEFTTDTSNRLACWFDHCKERIHFFLKYQECVRCTKNIVTLLQHKNKTYCSELN